ncbi:helix-turn-helix domain-containing protein [Veillonella criceti]|uniref:DNA binding domain, excisionase family n=1 Tax=Veillonella criceti TaxID=103891 RepID=A0A380NLU4_9FIRM|nr:helix-turn-helix domain-containing protein [Veillonella criceti]SUP42814.1 DNA binding domain, excisionase family [Veillonella criceti]
MEKRFMTIKEAAQIFFEGKISVASLYRLIETGEIPAIRIGKKYLLNVTTMQEKYG